MYQSRGYQRSLYWEYFPLNYDQRLLSHIFPEGCTGLEFTSSASFSRHNFPNAGVAELNQKPFRWFMCLYCLWCWNPCSLRVHGELAPVVGREYIPGSIFILIHCLFPMFSWKFFISSNSALCALVANTSGPSLAHRMCACGSQPCFGQSLKASTELQLLWEPCVPGWGLSSTAGSTSYLAQRVWCCA